MFGRILDMFIPGVLNIGCEYARDLNMPEF